MKALDKVFDTISNYRHIIGDKFTSLKQKKIFL